MLNQVYEEDSRFPGAAPAKDSFYYSMLSSVYCSSGMVHMARHYLAHAVQVGVSLPLHASSRRPRAPTAPRWARC